MKKIIILITILLFCSINVWAIVLNNIVVNNVAWGPVKPILICLGDSITSGVGTSTDDWGYREDLQVLQSGSMEFWGQFENPTSDLTYSVYHSGVSGETTAEVESRVQTNLDTYFPVGAAATESGAFLIHVGTNDDLDTAIAATVDNVEDIIDLIDAYDSNISVYVALIIPNAGGYAGIPNYNTALNTMLETYQLSKSNLYIVDQYTALYSDTWGLCSGDFVANCMTDQTHPNDIGYDVLARQWYECLINENGTNCNGN